MNSEANRLINEPHFAPESMSQRVLRHANEKIAALESSLASATEENKKLAHNFYDLGNHTLDLNVTIDGLTAERDALKEKTEESRRRAFKAGFSIASRDNTFTSEDWEGVYNSWSTPASPSNGSNDAT